MPAARHRESRAVVVLFVVCLALFGWLIVTRMELFFAKNEASDYRALWEGEMDRRRLASAEPRIAAIEKRAEEVAAAVNQQSPEVRHDIKRRLASIRLHFAHGLRSDGAKACPSRVIEQPAAAAATPGPDAAPDPGPVATDRHRRIDRDNADRMERLQGWVRTHMAAWHGVTI